MKMFPHFFALLLRSLAPLCAQSPAPPAEVSAATFTRTEDVVSGRKFGVALTLDVIQPAKPNGYGIIRCGQRRVAVES
jgi:hypothetical protein